MAAADYRLCDLCDSKTFYDASLSDDYTNSIGDWAVLCPRCAETFKVVVVPKDAEVDTTPAERASAAFREAWAVKFAAQCEKSRLAREATKRDSPEYVAYLARLEAEA